ncbi:(Fe-S)-binding protein [Methanolobus sp. WCC4]|uniref:(Fe-S)-binding protein n=1 Tax=Methanolobus sp. WCC4 TaxID=3125784 RepID=UPI0030F8D6B0
MMDPTMKIKCVSNAMSNVTRRKIMGLLNEDNRSKKEIGEAVGQSMLDYHLQHLQQAEMIVVKDKMVEITDLGRSFMASGTSKLAEKKNDLSGARPIDVVEIRQLLPCIADSSKYRIIARLEPPLESALKLMEPLFPRSRYSEKLGVLIIQKGVRMITLYSTGAVTLTMVDDQEEALQILDDLKETINEAIKKGITPATREKIRVDHAEIYKYLPKTNCHICGEQSCYSFAIRLVAGETTLGRCTVLQDNKYSVNLEHLRVLMEYL